MTLRVRFLPAAEAELLHETAYYSTARKGFGVKFKNAVQAAANRAARTPQAGAPGPADTRSLRLDGFPFRLVYRYRPAEVLVVAIANSSKRPDYWRDRIA